MLNLEIPEGEEISPAAVFGQDGEFVEAGSREQCELTAQDIGGLYCWIVDGKAVIRHDYQPEDFHGDVVARLELITAETGAGETSTGHTLFYGLDAPVEALHDTYCYTGAVRYLAWLFPSEREFIERETGVEL